MSPGRRRALRFSGAMAATAALAAIARPPRPDPGASPAVDLARLFPERFGAWRVDELSKAFVRPVTRDGRAYGLYDQLLERTFVNAGGTRVMLSVAYGREQSAGLQMHRPEICYRSGGYAISGMRPAVLSVAGRSVTTTRLLARLPGRPEPITYWTLMGGVVVSDAATARRRRLAAVLHHQVLDGLLVRISSIDDDTDRAHSLQARFADEIVAAIAPADRAFVIGHHTEG